MVCLYNTKRVPTFIDTLFKMIIIYKQLSPLHLFAHVSASGQPIQVTPLPFFFSFFMYQSALPRITANIRIITTSVIIYTYFATALFFFPIYTITATKQRTAISPPTNPAPRAPVVISVPIWYTIKAIV